MKDQTVSTKISSESLEELEKISKKEDAYIAQIIRRAINEYINKKSKLENAETD